MKNKEFAKEVILSYFQGLASKDRINANGIAEIYAINNDDKVLLEHIKALRNIFNKAIKEIENENIETRKRED